MAKIAINMKAGKVHQETSDLIVGIDLGTTNSLVAYIKEGNAVAVKDPSGKHALVPSVIHFAADGLVEVGDQAKAQLLLDPANTIYSVKRLMGKSYKDLENVQQYFGYKIIDEDTDSLVKIRVKDKFYTPIELSAEILRALKQRIEQEIGQPISKAVITVPAYFNDAQRQATRDAGRLAGLDVLRILNEPTAASLAYGLDSNQTAPQTIAVYDLGGGTFDISILQIEDGIFEVLSTNGDTFLGGDDFDRAVLDHWIEKYQLDPLQLADQQEQMQELRLLAESAKKRLSAADHFSADWQGRSLELSVSAFNQLIQPLIDRTLQACKSALKDAGLTVQQIDHIVMVGGSTRVPLVKAAVADFFKKPVNDKLDPDQVVALGAAIQADVLAGNQKNILLLDVTPLSLGIETVGGLMDVIIPRNSKVPTRAGRQYTTSIDGQRNLKIAVYQGERDLIENNRKLGEFILKGIPPMPAGLPKIDIQFILDADGILQVKAKELRSDVEQSIKIQPSYGLSEEEMGRMLLDSIQHAESDMKIRALLEARNEAHNVLNATEKFLQQNTDLLNEQQKNGIRSLAAQLRQATAGEDKDAINIAIDELNTFSTPLAHLALDRAIGEAMKGNRV